jgi:hypothetical protein
MHSRPQNRDHHRDPLLRSMYTTIGGGGGRGESERMYLLLSPQAVEGGGGVEEVCEQTCPTSDPATFSPDSSVALSLRCLGDPLSIRYRVEMTRTLGSCSCLNFYK